MRVINLLFIINRSRISFTETYLKCLPSKGVLVTIAISASMLCLCNVTMNKCPALYLYIYHSIVFSFAVMDLKVSIRSYFMNFD